MAKGIDDSIVLGAAAAMSKVIQDRMEIACDVAIASWHFNQLSKDLEAKLKEALKEERLTASSSARIENLKVSVARAKGRYEAFNAVSLALRGEREKLSSMKG